MELLEQARKILATGEEFSMEEQADVLLTIFGYRGEECLAHIVAPEAARSSMTKNILCAMARERFLEAGVDSCFTIMAAYRLRVEDPEDRPDYLGDDPRSEEIVCVAAQSMMGETLCVSKLVLRDQEGNISGFGEEEIQFGAEGRFFEILPSMRPATGQNWAEN